MVFPKLSSSWIIFKEQSLSLFTDFAKTIFPYIDRADQELRSDFIEAHLSILMRKNYEQIDSATGERGFKIPTSLMIVEAHK